ncbi:MAG: hypothetical protein Q4E06_01035, partial [Lautropia sp.]|nr:hypothetical protein [Lautropia sp.]
MATPTRTNKIQSHQDAIAKAKAGKGVKADLAKASKKPMSPEELEKLNVKAVDAEQAEIVADASSASKAAAGTEAGSSLGAVGGESVAAAEGGAAAGAAVSPAVIGAGVLGAVVIAAAAGGSSGGGSNNSSQPPLGDGNNKPNQNQQQQQQQQQPGKQDDKTDTGDKTNPQDNKTDEPVQPQYGQATAQGSAAEPKVAVDGETKLASSKEAFIAKLTEAGKTDASQQFIRIDRILAAEGSDPDARMVRYPEQADAQGAASSARLKAPTAAAAEESSKLTAYEVVKVPGGITRAEAEAAAEKMGGKLMVVDNEAEAAWLKDSFRNLLGSDVVGNGAWIGGSKLTGASEFNAAVRNEAATDIDYSKAAGDKLAAFVVEIPNYQHPLTLNGKPVAEGQVINADDFDKLVWNADGNKGGKISFSVVDSAEATEAGATKGELTVTESTEVQRPIINANAGGGNRNPNVGAGTDTTTETETSPDNGNQG